MATGGPNLTVEVEPGKQKTRVRITGLVDEQAELEVLEDLRGSVEVDLSGVRRFNSAGVRVWVDAMRDFTENARVAFVSCSPTVIDQLNMITGFLGRGRVESFIGPMLCEHCDAELDHLFETSEVRALDGLPEVTCPDCGRRMGLDDLEEQFLMFVREPTGVGAEI